MKTCIHVHVLRTKEKNYHVKIFIILSSVLCGKMNAYLQASDIPVPVFVHNGATKSCVLFWDVICAFEKVHVFDIFTDWYTCWMWFNVYW